MEDKKEKKREGFPVASRKNSLTIMALFTFLTTSICCSLKGAQAIAFSFNDEMVFWRLRPRYNRNLIFYHCGRCKIYAAGTALGCSCPQTFLSVRFSKGSGYARLDEDNCQYHLGIDHCKDRDPCQNGNEHADDQDQWSALKYN